MKTYSILVVGLLKIVLSNQTTSSETRKVMNKRNDLVLIKNEQQRVFCFNRVQFYTPDDPIVNNYNIPKRYFLV